MGLGDVSVVPGAQTAPRVCQAATEEPPLDWARFRQQTLGLAQQRGVAR